MLAPESIYSSVLCQPMVTSGLVRIDLIHLHMGEAQFFLKAGM